MNIQEVKNEIKRRQSIAQEVHQRESASDNLIHYYGGLDDGFKKIREIIDQLEEAEREAANERYFSRDI